MLLGERDSQNESAPRFSIWYSLWWMLTPAKKKGVLEEDLGWVVATLDRDDKNEEKGHAVGLIDGIYR